MFSQTLRRFAAPAATAAALAFATTIDQTPAARMDQLQLVDRRDSDSASSHPSLSVHTEQPPPEVTMIVEKGGSCPPGVKCPTLDPDLTNPSKPIKIMKLKEVQRLVESEDRIVVTFMGGVYDITDFTGHPGGYGRLEMVAGYDLEPFWKIYTQHNRGHILQYLQRYQIGRLSDEEAEVQRLSTPEFDNPYKNDPPPYDTLLTNTRYPYNAEGRLRNLADSFFTPAGQHYVRNHGLVPDINPEEYRLTVRGVGCNEKAFTLDELKDPKRFDQVDVTTVIQCNGNRREDYHFINPGVPAFGPPHWVAGAIGNATWTGIRLRDVLKDAGLPLDEISLNKASLPEGADNISFKGYDHDEVGNNYCCSIPIEKGIDPYGDVILAFKMNGEDIPRAHGYPVRVIVPGNAGARNCKFLERITVTPNPCLNAGNWKQYAVHAPDVPLFKLAEFEEHHVELKMDPVVQDMPVQSMICTPSAWDTLKLQGTKDHPSIRVKGFAWGGGGSGVNRVDVSTDGGQTFTRADLLPKPIKQRRGAEWSWQLFEKDIPLTPEQAEKIKKGEKIDIMLTSKALNTAWNSQPEHPEANYNPHGCCVNHWYKVPVSYDPNATSDKRGDPGDFENKPTGGSFRAPFKNFEQPPKLVEKRKMEKQDKQ